MGEEEEDKGTVVGGMKARELKYEVQRVLLAPWARRSRLAWLKVLVTDGAGDSRANAEGQRVRTWKRAFSDSREHDGEPGPVCAVRAWNMDVHGVAKGAKDRHQDAEEGKERKKEKNKKRQ